MPGSGYPGCMSTCMKGFGHRHNPSWLPNCPNVLCACGWEVSAPTPFWAAPPNNGCNWEYSWHQVYESCSAGVSVCSGCHPYGCCNPMQHYRHHSCTCTHDISACKHGGGKSVGDERSCNALLECQEWYTMTGLHIPAAQWCVLLPLALLPCRLRLCLAASWLVQPQRPDTQADTWQW